MQVEWRLGRCNDIIVVVGGFLCVSFLIVSWLDITKWWWCNGLHRLAHLLMISVLCWLFRSSRRLLVVVLLLLLLFLVVVLLLLLPITVKVENGLE